jgi:hypothetical protein
MERSARERQGFLEAVTYSAADLALSTAIDASHSHFRQLRQRWLASLEGWLAQ